ncbi:hypothetical protein AAY473_019755 [Plecturocebus cupreus]
MMSSQRKRPAHERQSHLDDAISNSKASFGIVAMGKIFSPCVFAAEKMPLSYDVIITDKAIFLGHATGENASLIMSSLDIRPPFHNIVTGTLPPSCDAITREGALPYDVIRGTVPLPVMSSPEVTTLGPLQEEVPSAMSPRCYVL